MIPSTLYHGTWVSRPVFALMANAIAAALNIALGYYAWRTARYGWMALAAFNTGLNGSLTMLIWSVYPTIEAQRGAIEAQRKALDAQTAMIRRLRRLPTMEKRK